VFLAQAAGLFCDGAGTEVRPAFDDDTGGLALGVGINDVETWDTHGLRNDLSKRVLAKALAAASESV
jgi:hypothetical protein